MPKITVTVEHSLGVEEALRRVKEKQETLISGGETEATNVELDWNGNDLEFKFQTFGAKISGTMHVTDSDVTVVLVIPMIALAFKGQIESRVDKELRELLS